MTKTGHKIRVLRNGKWQLRDIGKISQQELESFIRVSNLSDKGVTLGNFMIKLVAWIQRYHRKNDSAALAANIWWAEKWEQLRKANGFMGCAKSVNIRAEMDSKANKILEGRCDV